MRMHTAAFHYPTSNNVLNALNNVSQTFTSGTASFPRETRELVPIRDEHLDFNGYRARAARDFRSP